jgi:hypothetical protein
MEAQQMNAPQDKAIQAPLDAALVTVRHDLTLQVAVGDKALDVELDPGRAYFLAIALHATIGELEPWKRRADAAVFGCVHGMGFMAVRFAELLLTVPALPSSKQASVAQELERGKATQMRQQAILNSKGESNG